MNWNNVGLWMALLVIFFLLGLSIHYGLGQLRQQNHKISSMMSLVSTLAEEVHGLKQLGGGGETGNTVARVPPSSNGVPHSMIEVSDGEGDDEDFDDEISDIEDVEEDGEEDEEEEDDDEEEEEEEEGEETEELSRGPEEIEEMIEDDIQVFEALPEDKQTATDKFLQEMAAAGAGGMSISVVYMDQMSMPSNMFSNLNLGDMMLSSEQRVTELPDIDNESKATAATGTNKRSKPGVNELRQLVLERGLASSSAAAKMKKPELTKLLGGDTESK